LYNQYDGLTHDFTNKGGIAHTEIILPDNAPTDFYYREKLWNAVEAAEKRTDARTAREVEIALPNELTFEEQLDLVRGYVQESFVNRGMCADVAIHHAHRHDKDSQHTEAESDNIINPQNPHAHILLTTRPIAKDGFAAKKNRDWESRVNVRNWREAWAKAQNRAFERKGLEIRVSHESNVKRGIEREPTKHLGHEANAMERRGIRTQRGNENRAIAERNAERNERERRRRQERERNRERDRSKERDASRDK
jgi:ATP-dependent exoDNAse (exonuclease V) alpha subunit